MRSVSIAWDKDGGLFVALGTHAGHPISINAPRAPDDETRGSTGFSPTELMLAGAGACSAWDAVEILRKRRAQISSLDVSVDAEQQPDPPWTYTRIALHFRVSGDGLSVPVLSRVIRLSVARYCSVIATLAGVAAISATVELVAADGASTGRQPIELSLPTVPPPDFEPPLADEDEEEPPARSWPTGCQPQ